MSEHPTKVSGSYIHANCSEHTGCIEWPDSGCQACRAEVERDALREALERIVRHTPADTLSFEQVREIGREALERDCPNAPRTKESGSPSERIREKLKLAYYDKIASDIAAVLAERDALRDALAKIDKLDGRYADLNTARFFAREALEY